MERMRIPETASPKSSAMAQETAATNSWRLGIESGATAVGKIGGELLLVCSSF